MYSLLQDYLSKLLTIHKRYLLQKSENVSHLENLSSSKNPSSIQPFPNNLPLVQAIFLSERGRDIDGAIIVSSKDRSSAGWGWKIQPRLYTVETSGNSMQGVEITGLRNVENELGTNKLFYFLRKNSLLLLDQTKCVSTWSQFPIFPFYRF